MPNLGNTGQRYKMATVMSVTIEPDRSDIWHLSCGHSERHAASNWRVWTIEEQQEYNAQFIGIRHRCNQCRVEAKPNALERAGLISKAERREKLNLYTGNYPPGDDD